MYPVDLHMHTVASTHAYSTLSDYIAQAKQKGIKLFAITDHGPDMEDAPHHWHFINMRIWPRVVDGVGILRGIEANIKNVDGEIDCSGKMFDSLDLIIAGFHEPVFAPHDKATNTQAMIATIASGNVHIISHPGNPKYEIDVKAVAEAAAKHQVALEINNSLLYSIPAKDSRNPDALLVAACAVDLPADPLPFFELGNSARNVLHSFSGTGNRGDMWCYRHAWMLPERAFRR